MKTYLVGGYVRDWLRGVPSQDRDWVVVGATPEQMLAQGFKKVGASFPVFLHPKTKEEYALARQERKVGQGYHGFMTNSDPTVTLEDDLLRRDLTINAIALDPATQTIIDPFDGQKDWIEKRLKHVSPAFADDPLRLIRLARFYAVFPDMEVDPSTVELCKKIVQSGELKTLAKERIRVEVVKVYKTAIAPHRFWLLLDRLGVLQQLWNISTIHEITANTLPSVKDYSDPFVAGLLFLRKNIFSADCMQHLLSQLCLTRDEEQKLQFQDILVEALDFSYPAVVSLCIKTRAMHNVERVLEVLSWGIFDSIWTPSILIQVTTCLKKLPVESFLKNVPMRDKKEALFDYYVQQLQINQPDLFADKDHL